MSLAIDVDDVEAVLLADARWYSVSAYSFALDAYDYVFEDHLEYNGGRDSASSATGFSFIGKPEGEDGPDAHYAGPITAVTAVRRSI